MQLFQTLPILVTIASTVSSSDDHCYQLADPEAPFREIQPLFPNLDFDATLARFGPLLDMLPQQYGECIASYKGDTVMQLVSLFQDNGVCSKSNTELMFEDDQLMTTFNLFPQKVSSYFSFANHVLNLSDDAFKSMCIPIKTQMMPCVQALMPLIGKLAQSNANNCCKGVFGMELGGSSFDDDVVNLLQKFTAALCNTRPSFTNVDEEQTCGYTIAKIFMTKNIWTSAKRFMAGLHIPNEGACNAYNGLPYLGSDNRNTTFWIGNEEENIGSCAVQLDALFTSAKLMSRASPDSKMNLLYGDDTCLPGDLAMSFLSKYFNPIFAIVFNVFVGQFTCFHLPTGFSQSC